MKRATKYGLCLLGVSALFGALLIKGFVTQVPTMTWAPAGNGSAMSSPRAGAATVLLQNGSILITGGDSGAGPVASVDVFDTSGNFSSATVMNFARSQHIAVVLQDGRVLVAGGIGGSGNAVDTADIYNPAANTWTVTTGPLIVARSGHTASLLPDGTVLIAGGSNAGGALNSLEIFDPVANAFHPYTAGDLSSARQNHAAAVLQDGRVIIVGGFDGTNVLASSDIYDPAKGTIAPGPALSVARMNHTATTQLDGKVFVAGGSTVDSTGAATDLASVEVWGPAAQQTPIFVALPSQLSVARQGHQAFLLPHNGGILVVGGSSAGASPALSSAELYYPWTGSFNTNFSATSSMASARASATGSPLSNGTVDSQNDGLLLVAGGKDASGTAQQSAELYGFAWVKTDRADYAPGDLVTITGGGWKPGETVHLSLLEAPFIDQPNPMDVPADEYGNISDAEWAPDAQDVSIKFYLTATGSASQAQTTFTDSVTSVTITSPTHASPATLTSLPASVTVYFNYVTSPTGTTTGTADVLGTTVSGSKSLTPGTGSESITVTIPAGTANASYNVKVTVNNSTGGGANNGNDNQQGAVVVNVPATVQDTITTSPPGLQVSIDGGAPQTAPVTVNWTPGSSHTIGTTSPQPPRATGTQYVWTSWSDSGAMTHSVTAPASATTYIANFKTQFQLTLGITAGVPGGVATNISGGTSGTFYDSGTVLSLTATTPVADGAGKQWAFKNWTGGVASPPNTSNPVGVTMDAPKTITANYGAQYQLTLGITAGVPSGLANIAGGTNGNFYDDGATLNLSATTPVADGTGKRWAFKNWTGDVASPPNVSNPVSVTMNQARSITANYGVQWELTLAITAGVPNALANITGGTNGNFYDDGTTLSLSATTPVADGATKQWAFKNWTGDVTSPPNTSNPLSVSMNAPKTVTANYGVQWQLTLAITAGVPNGLANITGGTSGTYYDDGSVLNLSAVATVAEGSDKQWVFQNWTGDVTGSPNGSNPVSVTMDQPRSITANYKAQYRITFSASGLDGDASGTLVTVNTVAHNVPSYSAFFDAGETVTYNYVSTVASTVTAE